MEPKQVMFIYQLSGAQLQITGAREHFTLRSGLVYSTHFHWRDMKPVIERVQYSVYSKTSRFISGYAIVSFLPASANEPPPVELGRNWVQ